MAQSASRSISTSCSPSSSACAATVRRPVAARWLVKQTHEAADQALRSRLIGERKLAGDEWREPAEQRMVLDDRFDPAELSQPLGAVAETEAARLDPAQRRLDAEVVEERVVHADAAGLEPPRQRPRPVDVRRPDAAREAERRVVGDAQRLLAAADPHDRQEGAEGLLAHDGHLQRRVRDQCRWEKLPPSEIGPAGAAGQQAGAARDGVGDLTLGARYL